MKLVFMDPSAGFQIEDPKVFIRWGRTEAEIRLDLKGVDLNGTDGYFAIDCSSLGGLSHGLGFRFLPANGRLFELTFFRHAYVDLALSYAEFQEHLERTFGPPTITSTDSEGFPSHTWRFPGAEVLHFVADRFGPGEHVIIRGSDLPPRS